MKMMIFLVNTPRPIIEKLKIAGVTHFPISTDQYFPDCVASISRQGSQRWK
jgi:hypothetical protein